MGDSASSAATSTRSSWPPPISWAWIKALISSNLWGWEVGGVGPVDHLEGLVITGGGGELFISCLGDEGNLDVAPAGS